MTADPPPAAAPSPPARSPPSEPRRPLTHAARIWIAFVVVTLIWGSTWLVIRDQVTTGAPVMSGGRVAAGGQGVPASWSIAYRFLVAGIAMAVLARVRREPLVLDARGWGFAAAVGISQFVLNFNLVYRAEEHIASGLVAVVFAVLLVPNAVLARLFLRQRMSRQLLAGSAVAMAGVGLLFLHEFRVDHRRSGEAATGFAFAAVALLCASVSNVLQATEAARRYPMIPTLAIAMLIGAGVDALAALVMNGPPVLAARPAYLAGIAWLGIGGSTVAFPLYFAVIRAWGPARAAYSGVIVPVIAMLLSTLFEGYRWTVLAAAGAALAAIGLLVALMARRPAR